MTIQPIYEAEQIITTAVRDCLAPIGGSYNGRPRIYYQMSEQNAPLPLLIFQFQDALRPSWWLSHASGEALLTVRALAESQFAAQQLLALAAARMPYLAAAGYELRARYDRSVPIPPQNGVYQSAHVWRITIDH